MRAKAHPPRDGSKSTHTTMTIRRWRYALNSVAKIRLTKFRLQNGKCYYCCQPMWHRNVRDFAREHALTSKLARRFQATAEHLCARSDGGADVSENIVAACWYCNNQRHRTKRPLCPENYAQRVRLKLSRGKWHGFIASPITCKRSPKMGPKLSDEAKAMAAFPT